jgi:hypothetical protein
MTGPFTPSSPPFRDEFIAPLPEMDKNIAGTGNFTTPDFTYAARSGGDDLSEEGIHTGRAGRVLGRLRERVSRRAGKCRLRRNNTNFGIEAQRTPASAGVLHFRFG